jgi:Reverse transcriptase (RNA-dependent DNA polymerase)/gag-polypeptide of LTR copia-type/Integrase core domain/GAG-pre-integrase domain
MSRVSTGNQSHDGEAYPAMSLMTEPLNGHNHTSWARAISIFLTGKGKLHHLTGTIEPSTETSTEEEKTEKGQITGTKTTASQHKNTQQWLKEDSQVMTWLLSTMNPQISKQFLFCNSSQEIWEKVHQRYGQTKNYSHIFSLKQELGQIKQGSQSISELIGAIDTKWNELQMHNPLTTDLRILQERAEQEKSFYFLAALDPSYENLKAQILSSETITFDYIASVIQREESRRVAMNTGNKTLGSENHAYATGFQNTNYQKSRSRGNPSTNEWCDHCKKAGHVRDRCWVLHPELRPNKIFSRGGGKGKIGFLSATVEKKADGRANPVELQAGQAQNPVQFQFAGRAHFPEGTITHTDQNRKGQAQQPEQIESLIQQLRSLLPQGQPGSLISGINCKTANFSKNVWIIDSGASDHMTCNLENLQIRKEEKNQFVTIANGQKIPIHGSGNTHIFSKNIANVLYLPTFTSNLLSVSKITNDINCNVIFSPKSVIFQDRISGKKIGEGRLENELYLLDFQNKFCCNANKTMDLNNLWHYRIGYPSDKVLKNLMSLPTLNSSHCEICRMSKQTRPPYQLSTSKSQKCFELIHSDVWGPAPIDSHSGFKYFVTFIDDFSRTTWLYLLKSKGEVFSKFEEFIFFVENQFDAKVKIFRSDNGTEFINNNFMKTKGILHQTTCIYTPQQNGISERKNRHLLEVTRSLLFQNNVPNIYWSEAVLTAVYLINRLPSPTLDNRSPLEVLNNRKMSIDHLRIFGCTAFIINKRNHKLDRNAIKIIFLGYSSQKKGYKCYDPINKKMYISRDVTFFEEKPFFKTSQNESIADTPNFTTLPDHFFFAGKEHEQEDEPSTLGGETDNNLNSPTIIQDASPPPTTQESPDAQAHIKQYTRRKVITQQVTHQPDAREDVPDAVGDIPSSRPTRVSRPPTRLQDFVTYQVTYPIQNYISYNNIAPKYKAFLGSINELKEPTTFLDAKDNAKWCKAMNEELEALERNKTWTLTPLPKGTKPVGCKWVYKIKYNSDGSVERYKARLVAKGFTQTYGIDYQETFAPVAKMNTVRVLLSVAVNSDWDLYQMDVKNAFLQGTLEEEVYMTLPPGYQIHIKDNNIVCKLNKSIYGLKQSPRAWYAKLSHSLLSHNFIKSSADSSLFIKHSHNTTTLVLVYVDDIIITGNNEIEIDNVKSYLKNKFDIKDLGYLKYFLGIEFAHSKKGLYLSQRKYVLDLLEETGKLGCKPASTPIEPHIKMNSEDGKPLEDVNQFQRLVGKLIYLTVTRPDITFAVSIISQFMHSPRTTHLDVVNRILRYLKGCPGQGILMKRNYDTNSIAGYSDADWAGTFDRKSTTGYCTFVGGNLVTWRSKKQNVVARSSAEAEYRAMASTASELVWIKQLLHDMGFNYNKPMIMYCDNQAARHIASNPVFHERTKHIEVDCHFIREKVQAKEIETSYVNSNEQLADVFTKALDKGQFNRIIGKIGSINIYDPNLRGSVEDITRISE